jgi:hypothetical protein
MPGRSVDGLDGVLPELQNRFRPNGSEFGQERKEGRFGPCFSSHIRVRKHGVAMRKFAESPPGVRRADPL